MAGPLAAAELGLAVFQAGQTVLDKGGIRSTSNTPSFMHPKRPAGATWQSVNTVLQVLAWHPRHFMDVETFKFRLMYEYNGHDIRNARVQGLINASSNLYLSSFEINWVGQGNSHESDIVLEIVFNIDGTWDPVGRGIDPFWGKLIISAAKNGRNFEEFWIDSERHWVRAATPLRR